MISRRKFLTISAAFAAMPGYAQTSPQDTWAGHALGGEVSIQLNGPHDATAPAIAETRAIIREVEALFSIYDPHSALSRLNRDGHITDAPMRFTDLFTHADRIHRKTSGLFDPTIQTAWRALAEGRTPDRALIGWGQVQITPDKITLAPGQQLSFNGIAQGYATDLVTDMLTARGFTNALINIGEHRAIGGPFTLGLSDPTHGPQGNRTLRNTAIATSSPAAMRLGAQHHILHPAGHAPKWSTVAVEATTATTADGLSTALCLADMDLIAQLRRDVRRITLVDLNGDLQTL